MQVPSLSQKDPLEEGMATHPSIFSWRISWTEDSDVLQSTGSQRVQHDWAAKHIACMHVKLIQLFLTLCDLMDYSPPGHEILQERILEWVAMPSSRGSSQPRDQILVSCIGRQVLYHKCHMEAHPLSSGGLHKN